MSDRFHSAFISYKHDDVQGAGQDWAEWVGQQLEGYLTPTEFVGAESIYKDAVPARLVSVFRDRHEIPGTGDLNEMLHSALRRSRILVVLCSPRAAVRGEAAASPGCASPNIRAAFSHSATPPVRGERLNQLCVRAKGRVGAASLLVCSSCDIGAISRPEWTEALQTSTISN